MKDLTDRALNLAQVKGASYADMRIARRENQEVVVKNGNVEALSIGQSQGFGVRVIVDGAWGFAASSLLSAPEVERVTALAVQIARASALVKRQEARLDPPRPIVATYRTPVKIDPFAVPLDRKIEILLAADALMRKVEGIKVAEGSIEAWREHKTFASTEGSFIEQ